MAQENLSLITTKILCVLVIKTQKKMIIHAHTKKTLTEIMKPYVIVARIAHKIAAMIYNNNLLLNFDKLKIS